MKNQSILISGAGVAGPTLAYWLRRHGFTPTVVERAPAVRDGGYAVDFRGASVRVLERMGVLDALNKARTHMGAVSFVDAENRPLASLPSEFLSGELEVLRGDLGRILHEHSRADAEYLFGDWITALAETEDGVRVTFAHGPERTFDLVVGADGLHSSVRGLVFGDEAPLLRELGYYVSIFTCPNHLDLDHTGRYYSVPGKLAALYSARDNTEGKAFFVFASPPLRHDPHDVAAQKRLLAEAYAGVGWEAPVLLRAMETSPDFYFDSVSQVRMERWSRGRIVLLGDAAYCASPLSGMGSGLAVVGAYVLAGELKAAGGDHRIAFARYEAELRGYVQKCQKFADGASMFVPRTQWGIWLRNQMYRMLKYMPGKAAMAAGPTKAAESIALERYAA